MAKEIYTSQWVLLSGYCLDIMSQTQPRKNTIVHKTNMSGFFVRAEDNLATGLWKEYENE